MDPPNLKREHDIQPVTTVPTSKRQKTAGNSSKRCLFCGGKNDLRNLSRDGNNRIIEAARERQTLDDTASASIIDRILRNEGQDLSSTLFYHRKCYSNFTHKGKIDRLKKKNEAPPIATITSPEQSKSSRRSIREHSVDWNKCMFCQNSEITNMHEVSTMTLSEKIIGLSQYDQVMRVRMSNVSDLMASEGKYHLKCWVYFQRRMNKVDKSKPESETKDPCLEKICADVLKGLLVGHVYKMGSVWSHYEKSCSNEGVPIPRRYETRRSSFYDDVKRILGDQAGFVRPIDQKAHLLVYSSQTSQLSLAHQLIATEEEEDNVPPLKDSILQQLVYSALHIRNEMEKTKGHDSSWGGIDDDHVRKIIPDSLYLFLSILLGGTNALETEADCSGKLHSYTCNVAQDIVYLTSGKQKLTPKHIGLGLTLHQATRS
jgi:hypothetical protein